MALTPEAERKLLAQRMDLMKRREHIPAELLQLVQDVYETQLAARDEAKPDAPDEDKLADQDRHRQGAPVLPREDFVYDREQARALFEKLVESMKDKPAPIGDAARVVEQAVADGDPTLDACFKAYLEGDDDLFIAFAEKTPEAPRVLPFLVQSAMTPGIVAAAQALANLHDAEKVWTHSHCPICGSLPLIGELRDKEGFRFVSCSFCRTSYRVPRMSCAFCGESEHGKLSYFTADDETGYRVDVCETCKFYLKATDFRELDKKPLPLVDDLESLSLDILAGNEGYKRPTLSGFGF